MASARIFFKRCNSTSVQIAFKNAMSHMGSQAMILTAGRKQTNSKASYHGMTISSACSLSVYPTPLLQFNLHLPSYTSSALHALLLLAIHILPPSLKAIELGRTFANAVKRPREISTSAIKTKLLPSNDDGEIFHEMTTPFRNLKDEDWSIYHLDGVDIPLLSEAATIFICKKKMVFEIDSHEIWVTEVIDIKSKLDSKGGLLYYNRNFHSLGDKICK